MEKRNFVTSRRTLDPSASVDDLVDGAVQAFGKTASASKASNSFEKSAAADDEKSDSL